VVKRSWRLAAAAVVLAALPVSAQAPEVEPKLLVDAFEAERGEHGLALTVRGALAGVPDQTRVRIVVSLGGGEGPTHIAEVHGGRFTARLGPYKQRVLPGTYEVDASIHTSLQLVDIAPVVSRLQIAGAKRALLIGTEEEAKAERAKLLRSYERLLEDLRMLRANLDMWGTASTVRTVTARMVNRTGEIPAKYADPILREWARFVDDEFVPILASLRADHRQLGEYVLLSYFPMLDPVLTEIASNLDRMHASFTVAIHKNLGRPPSRDAQLRGSFVIEDLRKNVDGLAAHAYTILGLPLQSWTIDGSELERIEDANGDVFHSTKTKFEVRKPTPWTFDINTSSPAMRLRMVPPKDLLGKVAAGIELHDFPQAESFSDLEQLDAALARNSHRGFELKKVKKLAPPDPTMPGGVRPGQELRFTALAGNPNQPQAQQQKYSVIQYSLFCRWHKRTYSLICITQEGQEAQYEPTFNAICQSFKVLDAPHRHAGQ
jgi:hypothetical protein